MHLYDLNQQLAPAAPGTIDVITAVLQHKASDIL
jgi:hypothetical protein